jgi:hypothetical protein
VYIYKEFGVSPYKNMKKSKSIKRQEARGSATRSISVHHNELNDAADFMSQGNLKIMSFMSYYPLYTG